MSLIDEDKIFTKHYRIIDQYGNKLSDYFETKI